MNETWRKAISVLALAPLGCGDGDRSLAPNQAPLVVSAQPAAGSTLREASPVFQVTIEDPNRDDDLHVLWLIDYPPFDQNVTRVALAVSLPTRGGTAPNRHILSLMPSCTFHLISPTLSQHRLLAVVADRPFAQDARGPAGERFLDTVTPGGLSTSVSWTFDMECP